MKEKLLWFCTCIALEIMTAIGIASYLLYLGDYMLALIASVVLSKIIIFHFVIDYYDKQKYKNQKQIQLTSIYHGKKNF